MTDKHTELGIYAAEAIDPKLFEPAVRKAADDFYERLLESVQDYLKDNVEFNIGSHIMMLESELRKMRPYYAAVKDIPIEAIESGAVAQLVSAICGLGAMPDGYCFCHENRIGNDSKTHFPECQDVRTALANMGVQP